jgi:hypothetical protein
MAPTQEEGEHTLDNLSRMLADESVSRARAVRLLGAALVGGLLASIPGGAKAAPLVCEDPTPQKCGRQCCNAVQVCCGSGGKARCCLADAICCPGGGTCCPPNTTCCQGEGRTICCPQGEICCRFGGGSTMCATPDFCESEGGRPR